MPALSTDSINSDRLNSHVHISIRSTPKLYMSILGVCLLGSEASGAVYTGFPGVADRGKHQHFVLKNAVEKVHFFLYSCTRRLMPLRYRSMRYYETSGSDDQCMKCARQSVMIHVPTSLECMKTPFLCHSAKKQRKTMREHMWHLVCTKSILQTYFVNEAIEYEIHC